MAWIEARGDNWRVSWRHNGHRQSCTWGSEKLARRAKEIAEAHHHKIAAEIVEAFILHPDNPNGAPKKSQLPTVAEWADIWLSTRTRISPRQRGDYRSQLDRVVLPAIGTLHLDLVTGEHITGILQQIRSRGLTDATATRYFALLNSLFGYAVREKKIGDNPCLRTDWVRDQISHDDASDDGDNHVYLTPGEFHMIRDNMAPDGVPLLDLLAGTGARYGEATAVSVGAFLPDLKPKAKIRIHRAWKRDELGRWYLGATKGRNRRAVTIARSLADALTPLTEGQPDDALLIRAAKGGRVIHSNWRLRIWLPALAAAARCGEHPPLDDDGRVSGSVLAVSVCACATRLQQWPTPHDLRHSHTAWLIAAGEPIVAISRRLGHRTTEVTELVYAGILKEVSERAADVMEATLNIDAAARAKATEDVNDGGAEAPVAGQSE
jgi:integrase